MMIGLHEMECVTDTVQTVFVWTDNITVESEAEICVAIRNVRDECFLALYGA